MSEYQRGDCSRVNNGISSSLSQCDGLRNVASEGTCNLSNQVVSSADRVHFSSGFSSQLLGQAERGTGAAVYSHCAMPQGALCYHETPLMSSVSVVSNLFTVGASQANIYGTRAKQTRRYCNQPAPSSSLYYLSGYASQPLLSSQQTFPQAPSYPQYFSHIPQSFTQFQSTVPPPA